MKKISILCIWASLALFACKPTVEQPVKVAEHLYEATVEDFSPEVPSELFSDVSAGEFGCSAVRNGNFFGRNLDFFINDNPQFVVRTTAKEGRHATLGVAKLLNVTEAEVEAGLTKEQLAFLPWGLFDGINDAGLVCNMNVVPAKDSGIPHTSPNPGKPDIFCVFLVRAILDNCATVQEAKDFIANHNIVGMDKGGFDLHFMIADPKNTVVLEYIDNKAVFTETNIMTNFLVGLPEYTQHADGIERYDILKDNYAEGKTMEGMWNLLRRVRFSLAYDPEVKPFWKTEHLKDSFNINTPIEEVMNHHMVLTDIANFKRFKETGEYSADMGLWITVHNSTFDIENKSLWVTIREDYDHRYEFKLNK